MSLSLLDTAETAIGIPAGLPEASRTDNTGKRERLCAPARPDRNRKGYPDQPSGRSAKMFPQNSEMLH